MPRQTQGGVSAPQSPPLPYADVVGWSGFGFRGSASGPGAELSSNLTEKSPSVSAELVPWSPRDHPRSCTPTAAAVTGRRTNYRSGGSHR